MYRNTLAWDRNLRPGLFKSDPTAELPAPENYVQEEPSQLDIDLSLARDYEEIDRMNAELEAMYAGSLMPPISSRVISHSMSHLITEQDPQRRKEIENAH